MFLVRFLLTGCVRSSRGISNYFLRFVLEVNVMTIGTFFEAGFFLVLGGMAAYYAVNLAAGLIAAACGAILGALGR